MNNELFEALTVLEKEKNINKESLLEAIKQSLLQACKNHYGKNEVSNIVVNIDTKTCNFELYAEKTVVEDVEDDLTQISLANARLKDPRYELGDTVRVDIESKNFGRIVTQNAKNVILQKIREEERKSLYNQYYEKEKDVITGIVQRYIGRNVSVNLGKVDALLNENEMIRGEKLSPNQRIKVYVMEVKETSKGPRILVSRTHPELVKRLFENEVTEVHDGIVEIKSIAREAGSRTKIAVYSNNPDVDAVGACVGLNGARVNSVVKELGGEKIDVVNWDENPALLIENALSPAKVIYVMADGDEKTAKVVVPDYQLSLAIGREGQNARLAARLTGFKIDIKSETQARESGDLLEYESDYYDDDEYYGDEYGDGTYENGTYGDGMYQDGIYGDGTYQDGNYGDGTYQDGTYEDGTYQEGMYGDGSYQDGAYGDGTYQDSAYGDGSYQDTYGEGTYQDGSYGEGAYEDGTYGDGTYEEGTDPGYAAGYEGETGQTQSYDTDEMYEELQENGYEDAVDDTIRDGDQ